MKKSIIIACAALALLIAPSVAGAKENKKSEATAALAWKMGFLIPSESNFSAAGFGGISAQRDFGSSYAGVLDVDFSKKTGCSDDSAGVQNIYCSVKHRIISATLKKKLEFGPGNPTMMLGAGVAYMNSSLNLTEKYLGTVYNYHDSSNEMGIVASVDVFGLFDEYPEIFFQARYINAGERTADLSRMTNQIGGFTFATGYQFSF